MKQAISVSLGSSTRDSSATVELGNVPVRLERRGTDGDARRATALFTELDGQVDALGVGGIDLWVTVGERRYPLHAAHRLVAGVRQTPVVDGGGLKSTLEYQCAAALAPLYGDRQLRVLVTSAVDRYSMARGFFDAGHHVVCGDLMFALGLPIPLRTLRSLHLVGRLLLPLLGHMPIALLYPTGERQEEIRPRFGRWYRWADVIAGDCHYIRRHMPDDLEGKVIVTNTTTERDRADFRRRGVRYVLTTTPLLGGRTFGTNMMEAALTAAAGNGRALSPARLGSLLQQLSLHPTLHTLSPVQAPLPPAAIATGD